MTRRAKLWLAVKAALAAGAALASSLAANDLVPDALLEGQHWRRLLAVVEPRLKANPNDPQSHYFLSKIRVTAGDFNAGVTLAEKAAALDARNVQYRFQVGVAVGEKARKERSFGLARRIKREFETVLTMDPKHVEARIALIQFHLQAPWIVGGSEKTARRLVHEVMTLDPARGYLEQARLAEHDKQVGQLEGLYQKAAQAGPDSYSVQMSVSSFYARDNQKKFDLSEKHAREALRLDPGRVAAHSRLAGIDAFEQRWAELDATLSQGEKNVPDNFLPYYNAGRVLLGSGKEHARAERYFRKYLSQEPEIGAPTHAHAHWQLGLLYEKMGRKADAVAELQEALRLKPDLDEAKKDLKRLR